MGRESGVQLIAAERERQAAGLGWTAEHDDRHVRGELVEAALYYADPQRYQADWPWDNEPGSKFEDPVHDLVKAGALIAAEIDRLLRAIS